MSTLPPHPREQARQIAASGAVVWYGRWIQDSAPGDYGYPGGLNDGPGAWEATACFGCGAHWPVRELGPLCPACLSPDELERFGDPRDRP